MSTTNLSDSLDSIIENFDLSKNTAKERVHDGKPISVWLPLDYKRRYHLIQERTGKKFGRALREVFKAAIDKIEIEDEAV